MLIIIDMIIRFFFWLCLLFVGSNIVFAQNIQEQLTYLEQYNEKNAQEKIYLHLDKYSYTAGESIWFKAYTTIGISNLFTAQSGIAYVELIDPKNEKVNKLTIPLIMGLGMGDIKLNDTIVEGSYRLRAYTNWMRNAGSEYFYDRTIQISNGRSDNVQTALHSTVTEKNFVHQITLKTLSGLPLQKTLVNYKVEVDGKVVSTKRATTDEFGKINVSIDKANPNANIYLRFTNQDKSGVNKVIKIKDLKTENRTQLLPEGGKLVAGRINNIAVKSLSPKGLGIKSKVAIMVGKDTIAHIETNDLGMGAGYAFLEPNKIYHTVVSYADGTQEEIKLPTIHTDGYSILVNALNDNRVVTQVNCSPSMINDKIIYFVVHHLGQPIYVSKQKQNKEELVFSLERKSLPNGVLTISILDENFNPLVERPIFNFNVDRQLESAVTFNKESFGTREKVDVTLEILDDSLKIGAYSAAVVDLSKVKDDYQNAPNILSTLLLNSDIKGYIEKPGFYFEEQGARVQDLDYLLLTQGWRNVDWSAIKSSQEPQFLPQKSLTISGHTKKLFRSKAEPNAQLQLISTVNYLDFIDTTSNDEGYFEFDNLLFADSVKFIISAKDAAKGKNNIDIIYNPYERAEVDSNRNEPEEVFNVNATHIDQIQQSKQYFNQLERKGLMDKAINIEEVEVRATLKRKGAEHSSNLNGAGNADQVIEADELSTCTTLEMCLAGRLMGVTWMNGAPYNTRGNVPMQVVLDGMYIESDQLSMINVTDVESIEVLRNINHTAIYGQYGINGLLIITSKRGSSAMNNYVKKGIVTIQPEGLYVNKTFYKPDYELADGLKFAEDYRTTIHWEPSIVTDEKGKASFHFFTSDGKGKYLMIIEGLNLDGKILRKAVEINVK